MTFYFSPQSLDRSKALAKTKVIGIGAHPDDLEFMCCQPIARCQSDNSFAGLILTNGSGSSRSGSFAKCTDKEMISIRQKEQVEAAKLGNYSFIEMWELDSKSLKDTKQFSEWVSRIQFFIEEVKPKFLYTHNPFDRHLSHVIVCLATLEALRNLPKEKRPKEIWGCEVWRSLDWLSYEKTQTKDLSQDESLQKNLVNVFKSQIDGAKNYSNAVIGRKCVNAVFRESHAVDKTKLAEVFLNLKPLVNSKVSLKLNLKKILDEYTAELMNFIEIYQPEKS